MKKIFILLIFLSIFSQTALSLRINEIMYNPNQCSDTYCEWIELYNNGIDSIDLTTWELCSDDLLTGYINYTDGETNLDNGIVLNPSQYAIITDGGSGTLVYDNFNVTENSLALHTDKSSLCGGLSNTLEPILLVNNGALVENVTYEDSWGADGDGNSLQFFNGSWCANTPTPGQANICPAQPFFVLNYPPHVLNDGTIFLIKAEISGFSDGLYDIKIEIKDEDENRVGRIYDTNDQEWQSTMYYIYNASTVENGSGDYLAYLKIDPDKNYTGTATVQSRTRLSGSSFYTESDIYTTNVMSTIFSEEMSGELQESESSINILDVPSSADFGDVVKVKINVYRGDTSKYAVYAYIETKGGKKISEKSTMHFKNKFTNYTLTVPIQLKPNCDENYKYGEHIIIVEGLDEEDSEEIDIEGITTSLCKQASSSSSSSSSSSGEFSYELISKPDEVKAEESFDIEVKFENEDDERHKATVWSYVYRGNKCYCKDREENKMEISISHEKSKIITLTNKVLDAEPGDYKLKVNIIKDSQKTVRGLTESITVIPSAIESYTQSFQNQPPTSTNLESEKYPKTVYESTNIKAKKLIPLFIIAVLTILSAILIWKR